MKLEKTEHGQFSDFERQNAAVGSCERQQKYRASNFQKGLFCLTQFTMILQIQILQFANDQISEHIH